MLQELMTVVDQKQLAPKIFEMRLTGELVNEMQVPGQFLHILVPQSDLLLRRPISIAEIIPEKKECSIIYRIEGAGTETMSHLKTGDLLDVMGPLGNGFPLESVQKGQTAFVIGGGIGVPPLYELSKQLVKKGVKVELIFGFATKDVIFYEKEFSELGEVHLATDDGSKGQHGHVGHLLDTLQGKPDVVYACGSRGLLMAVENRYENQNAFLSLEARMACGMGACYACVCPKKSDSTGQTSYKVCDEGPVFKVGEVVL
ncbi:dihydroorotate dehydrogenase electron transfer subunit [Carnobacterium divergens]|uniref:Dihydroorotate dehydrogenase B (NAD(+)), electron transfer subunit n=1 Tax=Carnobacterium divergens DSM 20623 TaxID=1449336 RepID=A0A0R2HRT6_CARDV|nr:dihydroorotate dehydrogenase electron transfer subunit [Carnobacterium divergens]KRN54294.1 dihydroorotate oxidase, electron transfer subunit [Carnobacterium divergens DSM 20623]MDO0873781.1 dihydroorotate dehydrogenase electron transfer subunit [Carnobacterium divergens]SUX19264.1 Dihydrdoorotate oxidase B, electron transfer subunit [Carnobacterium divergens]